MRNMLAPENRSALMALIRGRGNRTTEMRLASLMRGVGIHGWRRHAKLPGKPDFLFRKERLCVFVHGCFWHGCPTCYREPTTNSEFWQKKVRGNRARDRRVVRTLRTSGYRTLTIWECSLKGKKAVGVLNRLRSALRKSPNQPGRHKVLSRATLPPIS